jgi:ubiquinone biosynthesis protein COQ9
VSEPDSLVERKDRLFEATLGHVVFDGWSAQALAAGAGSLGLDAQAVRLLFPGSGEEARAWLDDWADRRMVERMKAAGLAGLRLHQRIAFALKARIAVLAPHREAVRRALAARFSPKGAVEASRAIYRTVDTIWWEAGDASTDFGFYTKRGILAGIHATAVLYWLGDDSEGAVATEAYIDRRIADTGRIPGLRRQAENLVRRFRDQAALVRKEARL